MTTQLQATSVTTAVEVPAPIEHAFRVFTEGIRSLSYDSLNGPGQGSCHSPRQGCLPAEKSVTATPHGTTPPTRLSAVMAYSKITAHISRSAFIPPGSPSGRAHRRGSSARRLPLPGGSLPGGVDAHHRAAPAT